MPKKDFLLDGGLIVNVYKRRTSRNLRLSVASTGQIMVSIPQWLPFKAGYEFAKSRQDWLTEQTAGRRPSKLRDGQAIGKAHHLQFILSLKAKKPTARVEDSLVKISYPPGHDIDDELVQAAAQKASIRALRQQAERLLPQRLAFLAEKHGCDYNQVSVKQLKSRWGSCDRQKNIVLNLFLMQLPWDLIDYVLLHELTHTEVFRHGSDFWNAMAKKTTNLKQLRKDMKQQSPILKDGLAS
jgi:predicted metal-dependent hydrolase